MLKSNTFFYLSYFEPFPEQINVLVISLIEPAVLPVTGHELSVDVDSYELLGSTEREGFN